MRKESCEQFAVGLKQGTDLHKAIKIAKNSMDALASSRLSELPIGPVFYTKGYGSDRWDLNKKGLVKLYNFWRQVYFILLRTEKNER